MVKAENKESKPKPAESAKKAKSLFGPSEKSDTDVTKEGSGATSEKEVATDTTESDEAKAFPKIRLKVEEEAGKVKQFATAQSLSMHLKVNKAKRAGLGALHKVATWLTPKKK